MAIVEEPFTEHNGMMNSTLKVVRGKVEEHFRERIDYVYTPEGRELCNPRNLESLRRLIFS